METARINSFRLQRSLFFLRVCIVILRSCVFVAMKSVGIGACFVEKFYGTVRACLGMALPHMFLFSSFLSLSRKLLIDFRIAELRTVSLIWVYRSNALVEHCLFIDYANFLLLL